MSDPQLSFKTKKELLDWFQAEAPEWFSEYPSTLEKIKQAAFPGAIKLLKKETDETLYNFLTFLTELNIGIKKTAARVFGIILKKNYNSGRGCAVVYRAQTGLQLLSFIINLL